MAGVFHSVFLDKQLCVGCTTCIKRCPTKAIRVREGKAHITEELCIDCGECIRACPKGAKKSLSDPLVLMNAFDVKAALPAPSLYGQFGPSRRPAEIFRALRAVGFDEVLDVAWGACVLTGAVREHSLRAAATPVISSACPVVVRLIQQRFPSLIPQLAPFIPPVEAAARELRRRFAEVFPAQAEASEGPRPRLGIFFISPCTSKVTATRNPLGYLKSEVDAVLSFKDLYAPLDAALKGWGGVRGRTPAGPRIGRMEGLGRGLGWARSDGELDALDLEGAVSVDGIGNVIALLEELDNGKLKDLAYVEALACPGGCVGGPMAVANPHVARMTIKAAARRETAAPGEGAAACSAPHGLEAGSDGVGSAGVGRPEAVLGLGWEKAPLAKPLRPLDPDMAKALAKAAQIESRTAELPGLDCGACGAPDCRSLAEDIVQGLADDSYCLVKLRRAAGESIS